MLSGALKRLQRWGLVVLQEALPSEKGGKGKAWIIRASSSLPPPLPAARGLGTLNYLGGLGNTLLNFTVWGAEGSLCAPQSAQPGLFATGSVRSRFFLYQQGNQQLLLESARPAVVAQACGVNLRPAALSPWFCAARRPFSSPP